MPNSISDSVEVKLNSKKNLKHLYADSMALSETSDTGADSNAGGN